MHDTNFKTKLTHPTEIYLDYLTTINGISLTQREIEVISCRLNGRNTKGIANILSIAPKTVATHIYNATKKFGCDTDSMMALITNSDRFSILKEYYLVLLTDGLFKKHLKEIAKLVMDKKAPLNCVLIHWHKKPPFLENLEHDLTEAGLKLTLEDRKEIQSLSQLTQETYHNTYSIYFLPEILVKGQQERIAPQRMGEFGSTKVFFLPKMKQEASVPEEISQFTCVNPSHWSSYYLSVIIILKDIFPDADLDGIFARFEEKANTLHDPSFTLPSQASPEKDLNLVDANEQYTFSINKLLMPQKVRYALGGIFLIGTVTTGLFWVFNRDNDERSHQIPPHHTDLVPQENPVLPLVRSDLIIPIEPVLLKRPKLITQIDSCFQRPHSIQTVALIGVGGAGKTTLARLYAHYKKPPIVWEINAETLISLKNSFENLAYALSKTGEEKNTLREIEGINYPEEREKLIMQFVKDSLRLRSNWLLIYDNVEQFSDIQDYFPSDPEIWGKGKVILTTRDSHIQNNSHVHLALHIGELTPSEKFELFRKITHTHSGSALPLEDEQTRKFLSSIPSFPLDVATGAYYLFATDISYQEYLDRLDKNNNDFLNTQENILKESTEYNQARYSIIMTSLKDFLDKHQSFSDILLLICLLDSQNIPRNLLNKYKGDNVVDKLVYYLKKYSLVTSISSLSASRMPGSFSIHRSTQKIILNYLSENIKLGSRSNKDFIIPLLSLLEKYAEDITYKEDINEIKRFLPHLNSLITHNKILTDIFTGSILCILGAMHSRLGYYVKSEDFLKKSLSILENVNDANTNLKKIRVSKVLSSLGGVYSEIGFYDKSINLLKTSLHIQNTQNVKNYQEIARILAELGYVYKEVGNYRESKLALDKSILIYKNYLPHDYIGLAWAYLYMGYLEEDLGDNRYSKYWFEQSYRICKDHLPEDRHVIGAWVLTHLGNIHRKLGNHREAYDQIKKSLVICHKHFTKNNTGLAVILTHLAHIHMVLGNYKEARKNFDESLIMFKNYYPNDHVRISRVLRGLGQIAILENDIETAESYFNKALSTFLSSKHPEIYTVLEDLSALYDQKSHFEENKGRSQQALFLKKQAASYLNQALEVIKNYFPRNSLHITRIKDKLYHYQTKLSVITS